MATWTSVKEYLLSNYSCESFKEDSLKMVFDLGDSRSQVIIAMWAGNGPEEARWLDFHTPIGSVGSINLPKALELTSTYVVGGLSIMDGIVTVRSSVPLENLDRNEIEDPMHLLLSIGDEMEKELTGEDTF